jgi:hypothetical protein
MKSVVNWAVLGLVIERPSYGYELAHRLERRYAGLLQPQISQIYQALNVLEKAGLIEELDAHEARTLVPVEVDGEAVSRRQGNRQPKVHYRATADGARSYRGWVAAQMRDDPRRVAMLRGIVAASAIGGGRGVDAMRGLVDDYERACIEEARGMPVEPPVSAHRSPAAAAAELAERLVLEARRAMLDVQVAWIDYARREIDAFENEHPSRSR